MPSPAKALRVYECILKSVREGATTVYATQARLRVGEFVGSSAGRTPPRIAEVRLRARRDP